jgi:cysteine desulfurase family protein (TIGR01976 family)
MPFVASCFAELDHLCFWLYTPRNMHAQFAVASTESIRSHFPALKRKHNGLEVAYFDGPGGTQVPTAVAEAMTDYLLNHNANTHWAYPTSQETDDIILASRRAVGDFLNCEPEEIVFGQNMTTLTFHLARSLGRTMREGDEIIVTELDHHANVDTWRSLEAERGVIVRMVPFDPKTGQLRLETLDGLLNRRTRLVAIGAASNAIGTINDLNAAVQAAGAVGALTFVDAVHYAAHELVDVQEIGCDFLACSAYKFYGPHVGILYGRRSLLDSIDFPKLKPAPNYSPERAETGTNNHEGIAGAGAAVDFLATLTGEGSRRARLETVFSELHRRQCILTERLWEGLTAIEGVRLFGPRPGSPRTPTIAFTLDGYTSTEVARRLAEKAIFVSNGDFYALTAVERLAGRKGIVRAGCACYTTAEEVERLIAALSDLAASTS